MENDVDLISGTCLKQGLNRYKYPPFKSCFDAIFLISSAVLNVLKLLALMREIFPLRLR